MSATKFGIVYSTLTGRIRRVLFPDSDSELTGLLLGTGESSINFPLSDLLPLPDLQSFLSGQTGLTPTGDRYAIVNESIVAPVPVINSNVVGAIIADPSGCGDSVSGYTLIAHSIAGPGWAWTALGGFVAPPVPIRVVV